MIHLIYDMNEGTTVPDNKVKSFSEDIVQDFATTDEVVDVRIGSLSIVRSVAHVMKNRGLSNTNLTISYAHSDTNIFFDADFNINGRWEFCDYELQVLMEML